MDLPPLAHTFFDALGRGDRVRLAGLLSPRGRVGADGWSEECAGDDFAAWWQRVHAGFHGLEFHLKEAVPRRNLVFASWRAVGERDGPFQADGVTVLSFDQDGRVDHARFYWEPGVFVP